MYKVGIVFEAEPEIFQQIVKEKPEMPIGNCIDNPCDDFNYDDKDGLLYFSTFCDDVKGLKELAEVFFMPLKDIIPEDKNIEPATEVFKAVVLKEQKDGKGFYFSYENGENAVFEMDVCPVVKTPLSQFKNVYSMSCIESGQYAMHIDENYNCEKMLKEIFKK